MSLRHPRGSRSLPAVALLAALVASGCGHEPPKVTQAGPPEVLVSLPTVEEVTDYEDFIGRTEAVRTVDIRARVTGYLEGFHFVDGGEVKEGDLLFEIDPRPYQAALDRAEATLAQARARQNRMEADFRRTNALYARGTVSREEFDLVVDNLAEARAAVGIGRAERDLARLNVDFTRVTAPFSGQISRTMVDPGNLVKADDTLLTTMVKVDPIRAYFDIDERTLLRIRRLIREGRVASQSEAEVPVLVGLADEADFPHRGQIDFSDNRVDPGTGTLQVRGVIANPAPHVLAPGLFVRVRLPIGAPHRALMIDEVALGTDQGRKFLYVVDGRNKVAYRRVQVGVLRDGMRVIEEGLDPGERVVVSGLQRVRPGLTVAPRESEGAQARRRDRDPARDPADEELARSPEAGPRPPSSDG